MTVIWIIHILNTGETSSDKTKLNLHCLSLTNIKNESIDVMIQYTTFTIQYPMGSYYFGDKALIQSVNPGITMFI